MPTFTIDLITGEPFLFKQNFVSSGGTGGPTYLQTIFVGKHGNDSNDGLTPESPLLTLSQAVLSASTLSPSSANTVTINILDSGNYSLAGVAIPDFVTIYGPNASATGSFTMGDESKLKLLSYSSPGGFSMLETAGSVGNKYIDILISTVMYEWH